MGNFDRITMSGANFGNIMVRSTPQGIKAWAIDTTADLPRLEMEIAKRVLEQGGFESKSFSEMLRKLFDQGPNAVAEIVVSGLASHISNAYAVERIGTQGMPGDEFSRRKQPYIAKAQQLEKALQQFETYIQQKVADGFNDGVNSLVTLIQGAKTDQTRQGVKSGSQSEEVAWTTLKANVHYIDLRHNQGLDHLQASKLVWDYAKYQALKNDPTIPAPTIADPNQFAPLTFPKVLMGKPNIFNKSKYQQAETNLPPQITQFSDQLKEHSDYLDKLTQFTTTVLKMAQEGMLGSTNQNSLVSDQKKRELAGPILQQLPPTLQTTLAYSEFFKAKAEELLPGLQQMPQDSSLEKKGRTLQTRLNQLVRKNTELEGKRWAVDNLIAKMWVGRKGSPRTQGGGFRLGQGRQQNTNSTQ
jgi:hypothetical protein